MNDFAHGGGGRWVLALVVLAAACRVGTDLPGAEPEALTPGEATAIATTLIQETLAGTVYSDLISGFTHQHGLAGVHSHPLSGPYTHDVPSGDGPELGHHNLFEFNHTEERPCAAAGSVTFEAVVTGEGNPRTQPGTAHFVMVQTHTGCTLVLGGEGGERFVIAGDPYLSVEAHARYDGSSARVWGLVEGAVSWQAEAKAGSCAVDLDFEGTAATMADVDQVMVTGVLCGDDVDFAVARSGSS